MLTLAVSLSTGCGRQERSVVNQFFAASRLRDKTALQSIATVTFEPHAQGIVESFDIRKVSPEEHRTKIVTVAAQVKLPDGQTVQKTIVLTLTQGALNDTEDNRRRWIVTGYLDAPVARSAPGS